MKKTVKKTIDSIGGFLLMQTAILGAMTLRFAVFAPEILGQVVHVIGG